MVIGRLGSRTLHPVPSGSFGIGWLLHVRSLSARLTGSIFFVSSFRYRMDCYLGAYMFNFWSLPVSLTKRLSGGVLTYVVLQGEVVVAFTSQWAVVLTGEAAWAGDSSDGIGLCFIGGRTRCFGSATQEASQQSGDGDGLNGHVPILSQIP